MSDSVCACGDDRFEFNNDYREQFAEGIKICAPRRYSTAGRTYELFFAMNFFRERQSFFRRLYTFSR